MAIGCFHLSLALSHSPGINSLKERKLSDIPSYLIPRSLCSLGSCRRHHPKKKNIAEEFGCAQAFVKSFCLVMDSYSSACILSPPKSWYPPTN